jgi:hypothetical protein
MPRRAEWAAVGGGFNRAGIGTVVEVGALKPAIKVCLFWRLTTPYQRTLGARFSVGENRLTVCVSTFTGRPSRSSNKRRRLPRLPPNRLSATSTRGTVQFHFHWHGHPVW